MTNSEKINTGHSKKLKVCHVVSGDLWGGAEAQVFALLQNIYKTKLVTINAILFNDRELAKNLTKENIEINILKEDEYPFTKLVWETLRLFRSKRPDIVHCHGFKENLIAGIAAKLLGIPVLRTHHGVGMLSASIMHNTIEKINDLLLTNKQISVSFNLKEILVEKGFEKNKVTVIHNGINKYIYTQEEQIQDIKTKLNINMDAFIVGTAGRLTTIKGQKYLLDAIEILLRHHPDIYLIIVGDGPLYKELKDHVQGLGIQDNVCFTGFKANILDYINIMDIFTLPSLHEGIPIAILEAMFLGKTIVASNVGGIPEIIHNHIDGILVEPQSKKELSAALSDLINDPIIRKSLGVEAQKKVKEKFTIGKTVEKTICEYKHLANFSR